MKDVILLTINDKKINHENIDKEVEDKLNIKSKQAIFISRHLSKTGEPTLTTHPIGNYNEAKFGGKIKTLVKASPCLMTRLLRNLDLNVKKEKLNHNVCFEVTHHGPYLDIPTLFVEVGSNEEEWKKQKPADIVAKSILDLLNSYNYEDDFPNDIPVLIGIGGGHYAPRFTDIALEKKVAFGHMIPNYQIKAGNLNDEMLRKAFDSTPNATGVYIHRKSFKKSEVSELKKWFEERSIKVISSNELSHL
jgi:D-aminoacyl-tRNA deacylase